MVSSDLTSAIDALAKREGVLETKDKNIGFWSRTSGSRGTCADIIGEWAMLRQLDAVVWTNLGPNWGKKDGCVPSAIDAMDFLRQQGEGSEAAIYVKNAPAQIDTDYRRLMVAEFPWLKQLPG